MNNTTPEAAVIVPRADGVIYRPKTAAKIRVGPEVIQARPLPSPEAAAKPAKPIVLVPGSTVQRQLLAKTTR